MVGDAFKSSHTKRPSPASEVSFSKSRVFPGVVGGTRALPAVVTGTEVAALLLRDWHEVPLCPVPLKEITCGGLRRFPC